LLSSNGSRLRVLYAMPVLGLFFFMRDLLRQALSARRVAI